MKKIKMRFLEVDSMPKESNSDLEQSSQYKPLHAWAKL